MVGEIVRVTSTKSEKKSGVPGYAIIVKGVGLGGAIIEAELLEDAGLTSHPPKDSFVVVIPAGSGRRQLYAIACKNNNSNLATDPGQTVLNSTSPDGKTVKAKIDLGIDGVISLNGDSKQLVTFTELNSALQGLVSSLNSQLAAIAAGAAAAISTGGLWATPLTIGGLSLNITAAKTTTVKTGG